MCLQHGQTPGPAWASGAAGPGQGAVRGSGGSRALGPAGRQGLDRAQGGAQGVLGPWASGAAGPEQGVGAVCEGVSGPGLCRARRLVGWGASLW